MPLYFPIPIIRATIFKHFCGGENIEETAATTKRLAELNVKTILDYSVEGEQHESVFDANINEMQKSIEKAATNTNIPFAVFKPTGFGRFELLEKVNAKKQLSIQEKEEFERFTNRVDTLCQAAFKANVPVFIDAEETWIQNPVDELALEMMRKYNKEKAIVYNTAQLYRWDRIAYIKTLIATAKNEGFKVGLKLVRGAYIEKERERAEKMGYPDPMQKTKADTDRDYNLAQKICIENIETVSFCSGTHNEESALYLSQLMKEHHVSKNDSRIYFAQLLGMSDHISNNLAKADYNVAKYVPYGPVKDVTPYLIRRAEENTSIAGQTSRELQLIKKELERRRQSIS
jgi:proline dehydrogenase